MLRARAVPFVVLMALAAAACGGGSGDTAAPSSRTPFAPPATTATQGGGTAPAAVPEVLDFTADRLGGGTIEGAQYAGAPLAIWFWAPW